MPTYRKFLSTVTPDQFCLWLCKWIREFNASMLHPIDSNPWDVPLEPPACIDVVKGDTPYKITVKRQAQIGKASANTTNSQCIEQCIHDGISERRSEPSRYNPVALELVISKHGSGIKLQVSCNDGHGLQLEKFSSALVELEPPSVVQGKEPQPHDGQDELRQKLSRPYSLSEIYAQAPRLSVAATEDSVRASLPLGSNQKAAAAEFLEVLVPGPNAKETIKRQLMDRRRERAIEKLLDEEDTETSSSTPEPMTIKGEKPGKHLLNPDEVMNSLPGTRGDKQWFNHLWEWYYQYTKSHRFTLSEVASRTNYSKSHIKREKAEYDAEHKTK